MKNKSFLYICLLLLLLLITACTPKATGLGIKHPKKLLLAHDELSRWQSFKMEGLAEVQFKMFVFRKNFVVSKNKEAMRFDMLDSGVFGMGASNISVYMDSTMQIYGLWGRNSLEIEAPDLLQSMYQWTNNLEIDDLDPYLNDILEKNEFTKDGVRFVFNEQMRLKLFTIDELSIRVDLNYDFGANLSEINVYLSNLKICNLRIDKISYDNISVSKLK